MIESNRIHSLINSAAPREELTPNLTVWGELNTKPLTLIPQGQSLGRYLGLLRWETKPPGLPPSRTDSSKLKKKKIIYRI